MHLRALRQMLADVTEPLQLWRSLLTQQLRIDQSLVKIAAAMELRDPEDASLAEAFRSADESTFWRVQAAPGCGKTRLLLRLTRALCLGCNFHAHHIGWCPFPCPSLLSGNSFEQFADILNALINVL